MNEPKKFNYRWLLGMLLVVVIVGGGFILWRKTSKSAVVPGGGVPRITVSLDTNGMAWAGGIPLFTTNIRDAAFETMGALGLKASFIVPATVTNQAEMNRILATLKRMGQAGLFDTNQPQTSPYEWCGRPGDIPSQLENVFARFGPVAKKRFRNCGAPTTGPAWESERQIYPAARHENTGCRLKSAFRGQGQNAPLGPGAARKRLPGGARQFTVSAAGGEMAEWFNAHAWKA
jgi:hypothetical protein